MLRTPLVVELWGFRSWQVSVTLRLSSSWMVGERIFLSTAVHTPAWLTWQNCGGLPKSVLWQEKRTGGSVMEMRSVGSDKSFGVSVSFIWELKHG